MQENSVVCDGVCYSDLEMHCEDQTTFAFGVNY